MRNALCISLVIGVWATAAVAQAADLDNSRVSEPAKGVPVCYDPFLPVSGRDLPLPAVVGAAGFPQSVPQASTVEAIPTPTAFHAGALMLLGLIAGRSLRKLRTV